MRWYSRPLVVLRNDRASISPMQSFGPDQHYISKH
jgi:hypothetical protein